MRCQGGLEIRIQAQEPFTRNESDLRLNTGVGPLRFSFPEAALEVSSIQSLDSFSERVEKFI